MEGVLFLLICVKEMFIIYEINRCKNPYFGVFDINICDNMFYIEFACN